MKKVYLMLIICLFFGTLLQAQMINPMQINSMNSTMVQPQPFLFTLTTLNPAARGWSMNYSGGYGEHTITPLGYDGVDQNFAVKGYLGDKFTLLTSVGIGLANNGEINSLEQAEVLRDFIGGNTATGFRIGASLGFRREFNNDKVALSRFTATFENLDWRLGANVRFEKAFATGRDAVDVISSIGIHHEISSQLFGGIEAVGQDLEGFWETDEADGGAKIFVGPSLNYVPTASRFSFTLCGGPIIYATHSTIAPDIYAVRDIPTTDGFTLKFNVGFRF